MKLPVLSARRQGSALVTTLLVVVVLTIIVTAFLQSMTIERQTARSYLSRYQSQAAVEAGKNAAIYLIRDLFTKYPDSVTWWDPDLAGHSGVAGTAFSYYATQAAADPTQASTANSYYIPLTSGATAQLQTAKAQSMVLEGTEPDLNSDKNTTLLEDGERWIGSVPGQTAPVIHVPWVYLTDPPTSPNPANPPPTNPKRIARYAFWIEDDSFRVNVNVSGRTLRSNNTPGSSPKEIPLQGAFTASGIAQDTAASFASQIVDLRTGMDPVNEYNQKLHSTSEINYAVTPPNKDNYTKSRFLLTDLSGGLNLSRFGGRRLNLNAVVPKTTTADDKDSIQKQLNQITTTIGYRPDDAANPAKKFDFGNRFYRTTKSVPTDSSVSDATEREIYVDKIAANIRDYIDEDSSSTQVNDEGDVVVEKPTLPAGGKVISFVAEPNDFWAIGQEVPLRLTKTMVHVAQVQPMTSSLASFGIRISYYLEFWNMGTKDIKTTGESDENTIVLDPTAFIRIGNQPAWVDRTQGGGNLIAEGRDYDVPLSSFGNNIVFPAGKLTVLTTDPNYTQSTSYLHLPSGTRIYGVTTGLDGNQYYSGKVVKSTLPSYGGYPTLDCKIRPVMQTSPISTQLWDAQTYVLLGDKNGILDSARAAVTIKPGIFIDAFGAKNTQSQMHFRGGTLAGNLATAFDMGQQTTGGFPYQTGDPRANVDILQFDAIGTTPTAQKLIQYSHAFPSWRDESSQSAASYSLYSTLGSIRPTSAGAATVNANSKALNPYAPTQAQRWDDAGSAQDYDSLSDKTSPGSFAIVANAPLNSIGELGNIYDPAYYAPDHIKNARGGGRTLRIGQSEKARYTDDVAAQWDGSYTSVSRGRVAWRLCDIFSTRTALQQDGLINPNGVQRDGGAALLAALSGFKFNGKDAQSAADPIDQKTLTSEGKALVDSLVQYIKTNGPLRERGELSELDVFSKGSVLTNLDMSAQSNLAREQLFRRLVEMITTKGNIFTAYIVGQAIRDPAITPGAGAKAPLQILSTTKRKITFRLIPKFDEPKYNTDKDSDLVDFDPTDPDDVKKRFAAASSYDVEILKVE